MERFLLTRVLLKNFAVLVMFLCANCLLTTIAYAQPATITIPVGIGTPCSPNNRDSLKYYNYNDLTNVLSHRWNCKPNLASPGFSDGLATIQFNPFDGHLYFGQIVATSGQYTTHMYRWLPTTCPNGAALTQYHTFNNQLVVGIEFDPSTGYGYQINFVDTTGVPALSYDAAGNVGTFISAAIVNGRPASAQYDDSNDELHYSIANDVQGVSWAAPVVVNTTGNVGQYPSLAVVNGNPAIAYYDVTNLRLMYVRATNVSGTAWGTPVVVDDPAGTINVGQYNSLVVINGNPAIAYYDVTNGDLKYVRATDANGAVWGAPSVVDAVGVTGQHLSMAVVAGNPAIAYHDATNGDLKYKRATNATGGAWAASVSVSTAGVTGQYTSLAVINGNPAISFYDVSNQDLQYARATDVNGAAWGAPVVVANTGNTGQFSSLTTVAGNPAISYQDVSNQDLKYRRATDANGTIWAAEETPEATGNRGAYSNLLVADGNPAIAFYEATGSNARFIRSHDPTGDLWFANSGVSDMELQRVDVTTNTLGPSRKINFGSRYIYQTSGDMVMTPGRQMLAAFDNKYMTINWQDYASATPLVATFIDTLLLGAGNSLVGLAYASGKLVGSVRANPICNSFHREIDILSGALSPITATDNFTSADMTNIPTGVGVAKRLVSATMVTAGTYDVVYEILIKNYGGTPIFNIQAYDTLNNINGTINNLSASITSFSGPSGTAPNASFNGKTAGNFNLLVPGSTLSNTPGQNTITLRITCRVSNILAGVVYNNSATINGTNIFGEALRDVSANGANPDLNSNDKPDDVGENQPTPLLITVPAITPPCGVIANVLYTQNFGSGTGLAAGIPAAVLGPGASSPVGTSLYTSAVLQPLPVERYTLTNNANSANNANFINLTDHTGNASGRMLVVNADAANTIMYRGSFMGSTCSNTQYSLSFYAAFPGNASYQTICDAFGGFRYPRIKMRIRDGVSGLIITEISTADITSGSWQQYGLKFIAPVSYTQIFIELVNDASGGCGNDVLIDDIQFGACDPTPIVTSTLTSGCMGGAATFTSSLTDPAAIGGPVSYQWQVASVAAGPWANIVAATASTYTIPAVAPADTGRYYRVLISAAGNIANAACRFASPGLVLPGRLLSTPATSASVNKTTVCPGIAVTLSLTGGSLGEGASWRWYSGSCATTAVGTGTSVNILAPAVTTTYFVRAEGLCNNTTCQSVTLFVSCDIDKDNDGIPDYVESYTFTAALTNAFNTGYAGYKDNNYDFVNDDFQADGDSDNDGIRNYLDPTFAGRVDSNSDGIDDRFDMDLDGIINMLDLDSDNDGIPDVVEAGGVDANGDGRIDNYTDTDGDGLSQNVDGNISGAANSGLGLGATNLDNDTYPNAIDRDSDNDGIPDVVEALGADATNNAIIDGFVDVNGDGLHDNFINTTALLRTGADTNNDGRADSYPYKNFDNDRRANPYDIDSDMDGIIDLIEAGFADANYNGFIDGPISADGWNTALHALPVLGLLNSEGVGNPNYLDIDSDGDGIPDNIEGQTTAGYKLPTYLDSDNDGLDNAYDLTPHHATFGGAGIFLADKDGDGIPDYLDLDTDSDGAPDILEGNDFNLNGFSDDLTTPTGLDTDGDGLDNRFDSLNSVTNIRGTSYMMGLNGALTGDATPGTRSPVQKANLAQPERDWRYVTYVLPIEQFQLSAAESKGLVSLKWSVITSLPLDVFEIERSTDNIHYSNISTGPANAALNELSLFAGVDNIVSIDKEVVFYRVKATAKNGKYAYSNVVLVRKTNMAFTLQVYPNPARDAISVSFVADTEKELLITMQDILGKTVFAQKYKVVKGNNILPLDGLNKYANGVYNLQLLINSELINKRLIIQN